MEALGSDLKKSVFYSKSCPIFFRTSIYAHSSLVFVRVSEVKKTIADFKRARDFASFLLHGFDSLPINPGPFTININNFKYLGLFLGRLSTP